ncbi:hypothetical protein SKAU_G00354090 [Synaphobranchus kaupii]|uniref:Ig-like domain-containing protein n=1 Tax=Synaphobranchus kaupii TaxID=118154 RepID=A0A9Q1IEA6_SYNKA|nr:hypothetical protein SKAU_G00354090 [Synaphobranchus kaupii]
MRIRMRVFCWFLTVFCVLRTEGFSVRGPAMPLVVHSGVSVMLPCSVDTPIPLHELEVQWMRGDSGTLVHLFQDRESRPESQNPAYSGRAEFFTKEISKGNFSLLLRNVTTEDGGLYKCVVHTEHESNEINVVIDIERLVVTGADVPIFAHAGEDVILNCSVDTHVPLKELQVEWFKTNGEILVLLFAEGLNRPESQNERFIGRAEFFSEEIPKGNFSMKLKNVKTEDKGEFMCKVHTDRESFNATAWIQELGYSTLHLWVLGLTAAAAVFAVVSCIPALCCIIKKAATREDVESAAAALSTEPGEETVKLLEAKPATANTAAQPGEETVKPLEAEPATADTAAQPGEETVKPLEAEPATADTAAQPGEETVEPQDAEPASIGPSALPVETNRALLLYCLQVSVPCIMISIAFIIWGVIEGSVGEAYVCSTINLFRILLIFNMSPYIKLLGPRYDTLKKVAVPLEFFVIITGMNSGKCTYVVPQ